MKVGNKTLSIKLEKPTPRECMFIFNGVFAILFLGVLITFISLRNEFPEQEKWAFSKLVEKYQQESNKEELRDLLIENKTYIKTLRESLSIGIMVSSILTLIFGLNFYCTLKVQNKDSRFN